MSFTKALQRNKPEGYEKYVEELMLYKAACKKYQQTGGRLRKKLCPEPIDRLALFEAREEYSLACKRFQKARLEYTDSTIRERLREKGISLGTHSLAEILGIVVPTTMADMIEQQRKDLIRDSISDEEFEAMKKTVESLQRKKVEVSEKEIPTAVEKSNPRKSPFSFVKKNEGL